MSSENVGPDIVIAGDPFNLPTADVVFRTSDHVDFHVHKLILSIASPFFTGMFSLPQPSSTLSINIEAIPITKTA
ncbi:hypothetical protein BC835DRAFT_1466668 [Cytidiella melzeri]|nr:hypothetical protein BC835DRAFT_1466668 [Cytidiella melzeri]